MESSLCAAESFYTAAVYYPEGTGCLCKEQEQKVWVLFLVPLASLLC